MLSHQMLLEPMRRCHEPFNTAANRVCHFMYGSDAANAAANADGNLRSKPQSDDAAFPAE